MADDNNTYKRSSRGSLHSGSHCWFCSSLAI